PRVGIHAHGHGLPRHDGRHAGIVPGLLVHAMARVAPGGGEGEEEGLAEKAGAGEGFFSPFDPLDGHQRNSPEMTATARSRAAGARAQGRSAPPARGATLSASPAARTARAPSPPPPARARASRPRRSPDTRACGTARRSR